MKKTHALVHRAAPSVPKKKFLALVSAKQAATKRAKEVASDRMGMVVGVAACAAVGYLEKQGKMPDMWGFEPTAVIGVALAFGVPMVIRGRVGQMAAEAGAAVAGVAAYKLGAGVPLRVGEDYE